VVGGWEKRYEGCWVLWPLCVFGCISVVVAGVFVRDCRGLELCKIGTVGYLAGVECVGGGVVW
jgi:hypothetical protein